MDQLESVMLLLSWKRAMTSLGKLIRSERLFPVVWSVNYKSPFIQRRKMYLYLQLSLPQMRHLSKAKYTGSETVFCLPVDHAAVSGLTHTSLWLRMKKRGRRATLWEDEISPGWPGQSSGGPRVCSFTQASADGCGRRPCRNQVHQPAPPSAFGNLPGQGRIVRVEWHLTGFDSTDLLAAFWSHPGVCSLPLRSRTPHEVSETCLRWGAPGCCFPWDRTGHASRPPPFCSVIPETVPTGDGPRGVQASPHAAAQLTLQK